MRKTLLTLFATTALVFAAQAQDLSRPWTLEECLDRALENSLTLRQSALNVEQQQVRLNSSRNNILPTVSGSASESVNFGRGLTSDNTYTTGSTTTNTSFSIGAGMNIFDGFATPGNITLARLDLDAATADLEKARDDLRVAVAKAYVQVLYDYEILDVAREQVALDEAQAQRLEALVENGMASQADLSQQRASCAQSRYTQVQAENSLRTALLDLAQLLELPSSEGFAIDRPDVKVGERLLDSPEDIYADAVDLRPLVKAEKIRLEGTDASLKIARAGYYPTLSLSGGIGTSFYSTSNSPYPQDGFWTQLSNNFSPYVGLSLNVPVFDRFATRNNVRTARLNRELQQIQLDKTLQNLFKEIQQAHANALAAQAKYLSSTEAVTAAEDAFQLALSKYENGKSSLTEFNEARTRLLKARSDQVQATYEYLFQSQLLDFYRGGSLSF